MLNDHKIVVVMPAYNAARTLRQTYDEVMAHGIVDLIIVVDDASHDETVAIARTLSNVQVEVHPENRGYGANQKTCYRLALAAGADIIIMIHPDYQYTPVLIPVMAALVASGLYPCALASRILGGGALRGGMPWWKYVSNRFLTLAENFLLGAKLSEYHTGYRAFSRQLLERLPSWVGAPGPWSGAQKVMRAAGVITGAGNVGGRVPTRKRERGWVPTTMVGPAVIRSTIIGSIARRGAIIAFAPNHAKCDAKQNEQHNRAVHFHFHHTVFVFEGRFTRPYSLPRRILWHCLQRTQTALTAGNR